MPYIRIFSQDFPTNKKREMVREITNAIMRAENLAESQRGFCTVHFMPYRGEDFAIGGTLLSDSKHKDYFIEVHERNLNEQKKKAIVKELTSTLARLFELKPDQLFDLNIMIYEYNPQNFAIGGRFMSELERSTQGSQ